MNNILLYVIQILSLSGALTVLLYDKRSSRHCRRASMIAYLLFILLGCTFLAAAAKSWPVIVVLMTIMLSIQVINLMLARGNVNEISASVKPSATPPAPPSKHARRKERPRHNRKTRHV